MKKVIVSLLCLFLALSGAFAAPLICGAHIVCPDEPLSIYGYPLPGLMGQTVGSARVEIWDADNPDSSEPLQVSHVGAGILSSAPTGDFNIVLKPSALTKKLKVRVYDTDDPATANYRFDSEDFTLQIDNITLARKISFPDGPKSLQPIDKTDSDGDGLTDIEETTGFWGYFTDPFKADSDGDGIDDKLEVLYGLDPTSQLEIVLSTTNAVTPASIAAGTLDWLVAWPASTNPYVRYTLDMVQDIKDFPTNRFPAALEARRALTTNVTPTRTNWSEIVTEWMKTNSTGFFRVRQELLPLPEPEEDASDGNN